MGSRLDQSPLAAVVDALAPPPHCHCHMGGRRGGGDTEEKDVEGQFRVI